MHLMPCITRYVVPILEHLKRSPLKFDNSNNIRENKRRKSGKPEDTAKTKAFIKTLNYFEENDDEQISVQQLVKKME